MQNTSKKVERFGFPWESEYGYAQAVKSGDLIFLAGQVSHDASGRFIAPAFFDAAGMAKPLSLVFDHVCKGRQHRGLYLCHGYGVDLG